MTTPHVDEVLDYLHQENKKVFHTLRDEIQTAQQVKAAELQGIADARRLKAQILDGNEQLANRNSELGAQLVRVKEKLVLLCLGPGEAFNQEAINRREKWLDDAIRKHWRVSVVVEVRITPLSNPEQA